MDRKIVIPLWPASLRKNPDHGRRGGEELFHFARVSDHFTPEPVDEPEIDELPISPATDAEVNDLA